MHLDLQALALLPAAATLILGIFAVTRRLAKRPTASVDNPATLMVRGGEVLAACLIGGASAAAGGQDWGSQAGLALGTAALGALAQIAAVAIALRAVFGGKLREALSSGNRAVGLVAAGYEVAAALVVSNSLIGSGISDIVPGLAFYGLGGAALLLLITALRALTPFDDAAQLLGGNLAVAIAHAGMTLAVGLLVSHATSGTFDGWSVSLRAFAETLGFAALLVPIRIGLVQGILLRRGLKWRGGALDQLVGTERHVGVATLEAAALIGGALAVRAVVG